MEKLKSMLAHAHWLVPTWHSLLQYHRLEQPAHTNSDFFMPQPWQSGVFFTSAAAGASAPPLPEQRQLSEGS